MAVALLAVVHLVHAATSSLHVTWRIVPRSIRALRPGLMKTDSEDEDEFGERSPKKSSQDAALPPEEGDDRAAVPSNGRGDIFRIVGEDDDAYDSPFGAPVAAPLASINDGVASEGAGVNAYGSPFGAPAIAEADGQESTRAVGASLLGGLGGAFGGLGGKVGGAVSSVASKTKIGEVGGSLWERSSGMRQSFSAVTKDVASAMKEELVGVSSTVGDGVKSVHGLVATGSDSDAEHVSSDAASGKNSRNSARC